jgi:acyl-lipid omega-3 desaturase
VPCAPHGVPLHLVEPLARSFGEDHFVADEGDVVFYQKVGGG